MPRTVSGGRGRQGGKSRNVNGGKDPAKGEKGRPEISGQAIRQVLTDYAAEYKKYPWLTLGTFLLPAIGGICSGFLPPLLIAKIIDLIVKNGSLPLSQAWVYIVLFGGAWFLGEILARIGMHLTIDLEAKGMFHLSKVAFKRISGRDYDFYANNFVGTLTQQANAFSSNFERFTDSCSGDIFTNLVSVVFAVIILWRYSPWIPLLLVACIGVIAAVIIPIIKNKADLVDEKYAAYSKLAGRFSDAMTNIMAVKSFAKEDTEYETYVNYVDDAADKYKKDADYHNIKIDSVVSPIYVSANVIGLIAAVFFAQTLKLPASSIVVVFSYYSTVTRIFWNFNRTYRGIETSITDAAQFTQKVINPSLISDAKDATQLKVEKTEIQFKDVGFSYKDQRGGDDETANDKPTDSKSSSLFLEHLNLDIKSNQKIGLVGPSGGGKTTITKLLLRFIDVKEGSVSIDGQDISKVTQKSLRDAIAYVPQEPLLFHRTLYENIAYSNENATKEEVENAAKLAFAHDFIMELPHQYDTLVGERGIKLSGGQRQRVAIARAILKKAPILVLDEATSSLDSESEKYIQKGLKELMRNKTSLVIAHRLSTIKDLDRILVLSNGKIVQDGTHEELIKKKGLYATLWSHQSGEFLQETEENQEEAEK